MPTFADLPLSSRCAAAVNAIDIYVLAAEQRCELVALAVWPTDAVLPEPVNPASRVPDIDHRRPRRAAPTSTPVSAWGVVSTSDQRAQARELFRTGASITALSAHYEQPWTVVREWVRGRG